MRTLLIHAVVLTVIAGCLILSDASAEAGAPGDKPPANEFAYVMVQSDSNIGKKLQTRCRGVLLSPAVAVTAAHCIIEGAATLNIDCGAGSAGDLLQELRADEIKLHPTLDIAVIVFAPAAVVCVRPLKPIKIAEASADKNVVWFTNKTPGQNLRLDAGMDQRSTLRASDPYVIRIVERKNCLGKGDSGSGLFTFDIAGSLLVVGILINGAPGCPGEQTFVRLAPAKQWIESTGQEMR